MLGSLGLRRCAAWGVSSFLLAAGCVTGDDGGSGLAGAPAVAVASATLTASDCPAGYNVIQGTGANDTLNGTAGNDCILGLAGADTINGLGGNDFLIGGNGNDNLYGGPGNDTLHGEAGADRLEGGDDNDVLYGLGGIDTMLGGNGDDTLEGGDNGDTLEGGPGADVLRGGDADDILRGGDGNDRLLGEIGADELYGEAGNDVINGGTQADKAWGGDGDDVIQGSDGNDTLNGDAGDDAVIGGAGTNTINGGAGTDACTGTACEKPALTPSGCTSNAQCSGGAACIVDIGLCLLCVSDQDNDAVCDSADGCPNNAGKSAPGICGCAVADTDSDGDGTANCNDGCPNNAPKTAPGICGCAVSDADSDGDGTPNCNDGCPSDASKLAAGICGCGVADTDSDNDGTANCNDGCPADPAKTSAGACGCGAIDADSDGDGVPNCQDLCPNDPQKTAMMGICGCGVSEDDSDGDWVPDCVDVCPGYSDGSDIDFDGIPDGCDTPTDCTPYTVGAGVHYGDAFITDAASLEALDGIVCITGSLDISTADLEDLTALESLFGVAGDLRIEGNAALESLAGLEGLTTIGGDLYVADNPQLPGCFLWQLEAQTGKECALNDGAIVEECTGNHGQGSCGTLPENFECVPGATGPGVYDGYIFIDQWAPDSSILNDLGGVTCITGGLNLFDRTDLTSLSPLSNLQQLGGPLYLSGLGITDLHGLENLTTVGGAVVIIGNDQLTSLAGLENLTELNAHGGAWTGQPPLTIENNESLPACWVWQLEAQTGVDCQSNSGPGYPTACRGNHGQGSCGTLPENFECVPGATGPGVYDGYIFIDQWAPDSSILNDLGGVTCITGGLNLFDRTDLTSLSPLSNLQQLGGPLYLSGLGITDLHGLENLTTVGGAVVIIGNDQLTSLAGLENLTELNAHGGAWTGQPPLTIENNESLPACWVWQLEAQTGQDCQQYSSSGPGWTSCTGNHGQGSCGILPEGFSCVPGATGPGVYDGWVQISSWPNDSAPDLGGVTCITQGLFIQYRDGLTDLSQLSTLQAVGGMVYIGYNPELTSLHGLENLEFIGEHLEIGANHALTSLAGLSSLTSVGSLLQPGSIYPPLSVHDNDVPACSVWQLEARTGIDCTAPGDPNYSPCRFNHGTGSCGQLPEGFECTWGATGPGVYDGSIIVDGYYGSNSVADFGGVTCVTGDVIIQGQPYMADLAPLMNLQMVGGRLQILDNDSLTGVDELAQLESVGMFLEIAGNDQLSDLEGLGTLSEIYTYGFPMSDPVLRIHDNPSLPGCWAWGLEEQTGRTCGNVDEYHQLLPCSGNAGQGSCGTLPPEFECVAGAAGPGVYHGTIDVYPYSRQNLTDFGGLHCVIGDFVIRELDGPLDLSMFSTLRGVAGSVHIWRNDQLTTLAGLEQLTTIGFSLRIGENPQLTSLSALSNLTSLLEGPEEPGGPFDPPPPHGLVITDNASLPACWIEAIEDQTDVTCGTQQYTCEDNDGAGSCGP